MELEGIEQSGEQCMLQATKLEGLGPSKLFEIKVPDIEHSVTRHGVNLLGSGLTLVQYFLTMLPFFPFGVVMHILCHYMLEVYNLLFDISEFYN